jgi:hypothetical protein
MPVARKVWQPILTFMPSSAARRRTMRQASTRCIAVAGGARPSGTGGVVAGDLGGAEVFIEEGFELVMRRHFAAFAAFLVKADEAPSQTSRPPDVMRAFEYDLIHTRNERRQSVAGAPQLVRSP